VRKLYAYLLEIHILDRFASSEVSDRAGVEAFVTDLTSTDALTLWLPSIEISPACAIVLA